MYVYELLLASVILSKKLLSLDTRNQAATVHVRIHT